MQNNSPEFFSDGFIKSTTAFESLKEFLEAGYRSMNWSTDTASWEYFIIENTQFKSWEEMKHADGWPGC